MLLKNTLLLASAIASAEASVMHRSTLPYQDYGELRIAVTASYADVYDDRGTGADRDVGIWHPHHQAGFRALGSIAEASHGDHVNNKRGTILAALNPNKPPVDATKPALKEPQSFTQVYADHGSGGDRDGSFWRPNCPQSYVSLGDVGSHNYDQPGYLVWCLREDLARHGKYAAKSLWDDGGSGARQDAYLWEILPASNGAHGSAEIPLYAGAFRVVNTKAVPDVAAYVLAISLPKQWTKFNGVVPKVTEKTFPAEGATFGEVKQAEFVLPLTAYYAAKSPQLRSNLANPFARITRDVSWIVQAAYVNRAAGTLKKTTSVEYGFSKDSFKSFEETAGISVSASGGVGLANFEVNLNYQFTITTSTTTGEFTRNSQNIEFDIPPYHGTAMFCKRIRMSVHTMNGGLISELDSLANNEYHLSGAKFKK